MSSTYFDHVRPTYIENWPAALNRLSIAQVHLPLSLNEARALGSNIFELGGQFDAHPQDISALEERVRRTVDKFPRGAFVRLGSRSPKDSWAWLRERKPVLAGDRHPLRYLTDCSERMADDLHLALLNDYPPSLFVRQWLDIPAWGEFRCFSRGRKLVGVSQYLYREHFPEVVAHSSLLDWGICQFWHSVRKASHLDDFVFDVITWVKKKGNETSVEVQLLEINPFGEFTDPALFDWRNGTDFDQTFRFTDKDGRMCGTKLDLYRGCFGWTDEGECLISHSDNPT